MSSANGAPRPSQPRPLRVHVHPETAIGTMVGRASRLFARALDRAMGPLGVAAGQVVPLALLLERDGATPGELARRAGLSNPTMVRTLDRMVRDGLIRREKSGHDKRLVLCFLTPRGAALQADLVAGIIDVGGYAMHGLSADERRTLGDLLGRVIANLETNLK